MSKMLTFGFVDSGLSYARALAAAGHPARALKCLEAALGAAPRTDASADAHRFAAALHTDAGRFQSARRHLRSALDLRPNDAGLLHDLGQAFQNDPYGCDRRAAVRFRAAVAAAPANATYRAAYGLALVRLNRVKAGLRELKAAADAAPADSDVLDMVVIGLREANRPELAVEWLAASLFFAPSDATVRRLWDRARFDLAHAGQKAKPRGPVGGPATVPFVRIATPTLTETGRGGVVRCDAESRPAPHVGRLQAYRGA